MRRFNQQTRRFKRRVKRASLSQLRNILVLLSERLNKVRSVSGKKRIKAKIIITQMAIRNRMGSSPWANQGDVWANQSGSGSGNPAGITPSFINNMQSGFNRFGCEFLCNRLQIQKNMLYAFQSSGNTNQNWQNRLQNRINYITNLITKNNCNCGDEPPRTFDCKSIRPYCNPITNQLNAGNTAFVQAVMQNIASQFGVTVADVNAMYKKCCVETTRGDGRFACYDDGNCYPDPNGPYATMADCQKECGPRGGGKYDCIDGNCMPSPNGPYATMAECQKKCDPNVGGGRWHCEGGNCYPHPNGQYSSQQKCIEDCRDPRGNGRFSCDPDTFQCYPDPNGIYTSMADCQKRCKPTVGSGPCPPNDKGSPWYTLGPTNFCNSDWCNPTHNHIDCRCCPDNPPPPPRKRYSCDKKTGQCYFDPNGPFTSIADCQKNCKPTVGGGDRWHCEGGNCYPHPSGIYASQADCLRRCGDPVGGQRFMCENGNCFPHPNGTYTSMADCQKRCRRGNNSRRMKDCYLCDKEGGVINVSRIPINQPCPKGRLSSPVDANGKSKNPCGERGRPTPTQGAQTNFSGIWFNDEY